MLESARLLFETTLSSFGERVTFPQQILFAGASFRSGFDANQHYAAGESNVRMCDFFLHIFGEEWPGAAFKGFIELAQSCLADPSLPMRQVTVLFQDFGEADERLRKYRETLEAKGNCALRDFHDANDLNACLQEIYTAWWESVQAKP